MRQAVLFCGLLKPGNEHRSVLLVVEKSLTKRLRAKAVASFLKSISGLGKNMDLVINNRLRSPSE